MASTNLKNYNKRKLDSFEAKRLQKTKRAIILGVAGVLIVLLLGGLL